MIARCRLLLPFRLHVRSNSKLEPLRWERAGEVITLYPPMRSTIQRSDLDIESGVPPVNVALDLEKLNAIQYSNVVFIDGDTTVPADLMQIDFRRAYFDRRMKEPEAGQVASAVDLARLSDPSF